MNALQGKSQAKMLTGRKLSDDVSNAQSEDEDSMDLPVGDLINMLDGKILLTQRENEQTRVEQDKKAEAGADEESVENSKTLEIKLDKFNDRVKLKNISKLRGIYQDMQEKLAKQE